MDRSFESFKGLILMDRIFPDLNVLGVCATDVGNLSLPKIHLKIQNWINSRVSTMINGSFDIYCILTNCEVCLFSWFVAYLNANVSSGFVVEDDWSDVVWGNETYEHWGDEAYE